MTYQKIPGLTVTWHMKLHYRLMVTSFLLWCIYLHPQIKGNCLEENVNELKNTFQFMDLKTIF